jgi:pseudouridine synthase
MMMRISLRLARAGVCSRREAERLIESGDVTMLRGDDRNTVVVSEQGTKVGTKDRLFVRGVEIVATPPKPIIYLHNKKQGVLVTHAEHGAPFSLLNEADDIKTNEKHAVSSSSSSSSSSSLSFDSSSLIERQLRLQRRVNEGDQTSSSSSSSLDDTDALVRNEQFGWRGRRRTSLFPHLRRMGLPHLISVGRLDCNSEGLLVLTNCGPLAALMESPSERMKRVYRVRLFGRFDERKRLALERGMLVRGVRYRPISVRLDPLKHRHSNDTIERGEPRRQRRHRGAARGQGGADDLFEQRRRKAAMQNFWLEMTLTEGKNREIRRVLTALNLKISRIIRTEYGPFKLDDLESGGVRPVPLPRALGRRLHELHPSDYAAPRPKSRKKK